MEEIPQFDSSPFSSQSNSLTKLSFSDDILTQICQKITKENLEDLKFLCNPYMKDYQWRKANDAFQFFAMLRKVVDQEKFPLYVAELMLTIQRNDMLKEMGICVHLGQQHFDTKSVLNPLTKLLFKILHSLDKESANEIANKLNSLILHSKDSMDLDVLFLELSGNDTVKQQFLEKLLLELRKEENIFADKLQQFVNNLNCPSNSIVAVSPESENQVASASSFAPDDCYMWSTNLSGLCVIINIESYNKTEPNVQRLSKRNGTNIDKDKLEEVFKSFAFRVIVYKDLSAIEILQLMTNLANHNQTAFSCFVCCILTHGDEGLIAGADSKFLDINNDIVYPFCRNCKTMVNKPKVFIIQACQGPEVMRPVGFDCEEDGPTINVPDVSASRYAPEIVDFVIALSVLPKFKATRSASQGSQFISHLTEELSKNGHRLSFLDILTKVNNKMANENFQLKTMIGIVKQVPGPRFTLRKTLIFRKKGQKHLIHQ